MAVADITEPVHGSEAARHGGWRWQIRGAEHFRRCSYCGSLHPADLAAAGGRVDWADQKYGWPHKFYIDVPNRDPEAVHCVGSYRGPLDQMREGWVPAAELTRAQQEIVRRDGMVLADDWATAYTFGTRPYHHGKFYTAHLADPDLEPGIKAAVEDLCGLRFTFSTGRVFWERAY
jgi:hypothetical protein